MKYKLYMIYLSGTISLLFLVLSLFFEIRFLIFFFIFFSLFIFFQFFTLLKHILKIEEHVSNKKNEDIQNTINDEQSAHEHPIIKAAKKRLQSKL
tara:strand:+ start:1592 stop:1876 length:285 start_codon:yes stop_codon:yes gene_type:complete